MYRYKIDHVIMLQGFNKFMLSIKFEIASPETILSWSYGEVCNSNCLDEGGKSIMDGLFYPKIFGSRNKTECLCKTSTLTQSFDCMVCHVCLDGNKTKLRSRFEHISLAPPMGSHIVLQDNVKHLGIVVKIWMLKQFTI